MTHAKRVLACVQSLETKKGAYPLVLGIVRRHVHRTGTPVDYDDVLAEGYLGLVKAVNRFAKKKKTKISTYATIVVDGAVRDIIRREAVYAKRMPTDGLEDLGSTFVIKATETVEETILRFQIRKVLIRTASRVLSKFEAFVILQSYFEEKGNDDIAELAECSVSKVNKAKKRAIEKLRVALVSRGLR